MREGHFARHIQRMRRLYGERRAATVAGLQNVLGDHVHIDTPPGGMHVILRLRGAQVDRDLVSRMREDGLSGEALTAWTTVGDGVSAVLLNFTNITTQATAEALGRRILALMKT